MRRGNFTRTANTNDSSLVSLTIQDQRGVSSAGLVGQLAYEANGQQLRNRRALLHQLLKLVAGAIALFRSNGLQLNSDDAAEHCEEGFRILRKRANESEDP